MTKKAYWKMKEWKMQDMEHGRKCTSWEMIEESYLENDRMENAHPDNDRKITRLKMTETAHPENESMENT